MIGAAARNTAVAEHPAVRTRYPMLTRAIVAGASAQIRNMATVGGNLLQRTRCTYFYDTDGSRCNKRSPGEGCDAIDGFNRDPRDPRRRRRRAWRPTRRTCASRSPRWTPSSTSAARSGERTVALCDLHRLPEDRPDLETVLEPGELITAVQLPAPPFRRRRPTAKCATAPATRSRWSRSPPRSSSTATRSPTSALALGGVAPKPWRAWRAEEALRGRPATEPDLP